MSATFADAPVQAGHGPAPVLRPMRIEDLDDVLEIELRAYPFPWTRGIFEDCLRAGYPAWVLVEADTIMGYAVLSVAGTRWHDYGKAPRPGRKIGHITVLAQDDEQLAQRVAAVERLLVNDLG